MVDVSKCPSIIARPYIQASKKDDQWKDLQRYTFENLIAYLACLAVSDLMNIYVNARLSTSEEGTNDQRDVQEALRNIEALKRIGLEQMSLGKWAQTLRETTKVLQDYSDQSLIPELQSLFQPAGNKLWKEIDHLISIRNKDAHGNPIAPDKLVAELTHRQEILDRILDQCDFISQYQVAIFDQLILDADKQMIAGKAFINDGEESVLVGTELEPPMNEVVLIDEQATFCLRLRPLMIFASIVGQESNQLAIFSKQLTRDGDKVHFLGVDGAVDITISEFDVKFEQTLADSWKYLNEVYSEENVFRASLAGAIASLKTMEVDEDNLLKIQLKNIDSIDLYEIKGTVRLPSQFSAIATQAYENVTFNYDQNASVLHFELDEMADGQSLELEVNFIALSQGGIRIPSPLVSYKYHRTESDREVGKLTDEDTNLDGTFIEVKDPKSPDKIEPLINIDRRYLAINDGNIQSIKIGEKFIYELTLHNIGLGAARDVALEVGLPEGLDLLEGAQELVLNLNPMENRSFRYMVTTRTPGKYKILTRDLSYRDFDGKKYLSSFTDDYSILVRSDIEKQFEYELADAIADFTLDEEEIRNIEVRKKAMRVIYGDEVEVFYNKALFDAALKKVRSLVSKIAKQREYTVKEEIVEESKQQLKVSGRPARKSLVFSVNTVPFFAIDITQNDKLVFHSLDSKMLDRMYDFTYSGLFASKETSGYILPLSIDYKTVLNSTNLDVSFFKKWINLSITVIEKEYLPWIEAKNILQDRLGISLSYQRGMFSKEFSIGEHQFVTETGITGIFISNRLQKKSIVIKLNSSSAAAKYINQFAIELSGLIFTLHNNLGQSNMDLTQRSTDPKRIDWRTEESDRVTGLPAIEITDLSANGLTQGIDIFLKLIDYHRLFVSYHIFEQETFATQTYLDLIKENIEPLFKLGFALRQPLNRTDRLGIRMDNAIEVYSFKEFKLGQTQRHDCIGFFGAKRKSWDFYINFYRELDNDELTTRCEQFIKFLPQWDQGVSATNRLFLLERQTDEPDDLDRTRLFFELLLLSAKAHSKGAKSIWPQFISQQLMIEYLSYLPDVELLLEYLLDNTITRVDAEKTLFPGDKKKALKKMLRLGTDFRDKYNMLTPIKENNGVLSLDPQYRDRVEAMAKVEGGLAAQKKLNPLVEYLQPLVSSCEYVKSRTVDQSLGQIWGSFDLRNTEDEKITVAIRLSNTVISAYVVSTISAKQQEELVNNIYESINSKLSDYFSLEFTDTKIKGRDATKFSLKKGHNDYSLMQNAESMAELHAKLSLFFSTVIGMLETELK